MRLRACVLLVLAAFAAASCDSGDSAKPAAGGAAKALSAPVKAGSKAERDIPLGQLPPNVDPLHYRIDLTINPDQRRYEGVVEIEIELKAPRREIYLHGRDLSVGRVTARAPGRPDVAGTYTEVDPSGVALVAFDQQLPAGRFKVTLPFTAAFETQPDSLTSMSESGIRYVWTQFQEISARRAFPGFDEPRFKTPFDISITHIARHQAISNTLPVSQEPVAEGVTRTTFATTAPLPTYLVAIAVGPYEVASGPPVPPSKIRPQPLPVRAVSVMGKIATAQFALKETPRLVSGLEDYFAAPFPYPKLDLIAPPNFLAGGMENAGAITYTERGLLLGDRPSIAQRRYFKLLHAHEVAHQWFGDLVTPRWWNDIWLNEAFASWLGNRISSDLWSEDEIGRETVREALDVMDLDALSSARAIRQPIVTNDDIFNAFDGLTYDKGAAVLQMFEQYLGPETFREGVRLHMRRFAHGTADTDDFLASLAAASRKPDIVRAMETFLNQPGLPLVTVETTCTGKDLNVTIRQSPYGASTAKDPRTWSVPVCMRELGKGRKLPCTMLTATPRTFTVRKLCNVPLMPNTDAAGYYRFTMPAADWSRLAGSFKSLNAAEQLALLHALRAAFRADGNIAPTFVAALEDAVNTGAWDVVELATTFLRELRDDLLNPASHAGFEASLARSFDKPFARLQPPSGAETPGRALARAAHAMLAVSVARDPEALAALAPQGNALLEAVARGDKASFDEMTPARLHAAISTGGSDSARKGIAALNATPQAEQRNMIVRALAAAREPQAIASIQSFILSGDLRVREIFNYMREAFASSPSREAAWAWLRRDYDRIVEVTGAGSQSRLVSLPASLCTKAHEDEIRSFFEPRAGKIVSAPRKLANTLETVARCHAWRKATAASIEAALLPPKP